MMMPMEISTAGTIYFFTSTPPLIPTDADSLEFNNAYLVPLVFSTLKCQLFRCIPNYYKKHVTFLPVMRYKHSVKPFKTFYLENKDKVFAYLIRLTGDYQLSVDAMQEGFTKMLSHYGPQRQSVALLFKIARNAAMDDVRRRQPRQHGEYNPEDDGHNPEKMVLVREEYRNVLAAMSQLDKMERDILALAISSELSYRDIAGIVGISAANVRVKIHRARMKLKETLKSGDDEK
jgi:RNA polymerase sigma-70 factor (ECF subfamily)